MSTTLDKKMGWKEILNGAVAELKDALASAIPDDQKLAQIEQKLEEDVAAKRQLAREIGGQMRAIADPETKELEPLEALKARRQKLVDLAATLIDPATGMPKRGAAPKLKAIQDEIKGLDKLIGAQQVTYDTLREGYDIAKGSYQDALDALERVRSQGKAVLRTIAAHRQAQEMRDQARSSKSVDVSFMDDLTGELSQVRAEARSDEALDADLDAMNSFNIDAALKADEDAEVDAALMAEFRAAAAAKAA